MKTRPFGWTGDRVSVIGQGTWNMERARESSIRSLRAGLDAGMNLIDTAELYGSGKVEEIVGEALVGRRDEAFLVSKVLPSNASRRGTIQACERSLKRLGTDRLDLYLLHWPGSHPVEQTLAAFEELVKEGKIRYFGFSNFDAQELEDAQTRGGPRRIATDQVFYHLEERAIEHAELPWCSRNDVALMAYSPFGSGHFPLESSAGGRVLSDIAKAHGATARQVALAFLVRDPVVFAIPKAARPEHVTENAASADLVLTPSEVAQIDAAFPRGKRPARLPTL